MKVFYGFDNIDALKNSVVTTGTFDGVHYGHKTILKRIRNLASEHNGESVLISFHPHPRKVLYPDSAGKDLKMITTIEEKIELLEREGLDNLILVRFTTEFSRISSYDFINNFVFPKLKPSVIVAGFNHHFGHNKEGDFNYLKQVSSKFGFIAEEIPEQEIQNETVSSTEIRKALAEGYIQRVNAYLDHYYHITGMAEAVDNESCDTVDIIFKLRIEDNEKLLPLEGIYAVSLPADDSIIRGLAVISPQISADREVLLVAFENDPSKIPGGDRLRLNFHKRIRNVISGKKSGRYPVPESVIDEAKELIF